MTISLIRRPGAAASGAAERRPESQWTTWDKDRRGRDRRAGLTSGLGPGGLGGLLRPARRRAMAATAAGATGR